MVGWHHQLNGREFEQILGDLVVLEARLEKSRKEQIHTPWNLASS